MKPKKILLVAGEVSGDLHGAHLIEAIRHIHPEIQFFGVGGEQLQKKGMKLLYHAHHLSVVGITEVFLKLRSILTAYAGVKKAIDQERPDLVILIDFPDFNLRVARAARQKGIPVLYYISPQIWAWRPKRVKVIAKRVNKMVVLLPFEVPFYENAGVDVEWVGHPLLDLVKPTLPKEAAFKHFDLDPKRRTVGLLPGSRMHEVERLFPPLLDSARLLKEEIPGLQFIVPLAPGIPMEILSRSIKKVSFPVKVVEGMNYDVMNLSELLIMASGTATLEGAILGKPMIIVYKVSSPSYWIGRALVSVDSIGLVNLVAGKKVAPELIQKEVHPQRIAEEAFRILRNPILQKQMTEAMGEVRKRLGKPGAADRAARIALSLLHSG
ncbi:MAG: lipid-A-disaccharide synthase [Deltaproteobacteria bacterium RBG_16_50_11]|nr:MAG: lipid-A-disaccharide synthase [Deltaproteobacteria bacterium RBG_16_50_11]